MFLARKLRAVALLAIVATASPIAGWSAEPTSEVLTNASDILALSSERASLAIKILVTGVVTTAEPNWAGRFFVQDASGGVFVNNTNGKAPLPGDLITVAGVSMKGGYAPCIDAPQWQKLGTAPLPAAKVPTIEQFMAGDEDSQRVEMSGTVRSAFTNYDRLGVQLVSGGYRFTAFSPIWPGLDPRTLVGARVRVRGTAGVSFNRELRHFLTIVIYAPFASDFVVEQPAVADLFKEPLTPLTGIAQYQNGRSSGGRIHVKGFVTYQRLGEDLFLADTNSGLQVKSPQATSFLPGDVVEAVGFPGVQNFLPVLEDAILRKTSDPRTNVTPSSVPLGDLEKGLHNASFITLKGNLLNRLTKGVKPSIGGLISSRIVLVLQNGTNFVFTAEKEVAEDDYFLTSIPIEAQSK